MALNAWGAKLAGYEQTKLWKTTLGTTPVQGDKEALAQLYAAYMTFRERAGALTSRISSSLPNLTIHDVTHLDALWETADLIAGDDYPLNPAEAFVFGGAVLLHDSALCFEAYENGQAGLRESVEWKDAFAATSATGSMLEGDAMAEADFSAMRALHAKRAGELATKFWKTPEGDKLYLIENYRLRTHYGEIIGQVAASHHWPVEDLLSKLPSQVNALPQFPREWRVDPIKIACLLRCADAAHIDNVRAPDFLRALSNLHGVSASHWQAQNWLERVDVDASDPEQSSLIFTSGCPFAEKDAEAWWVAFDAIKLVDRELLSAANLLESRPQAQFSPPFKIRRVTGATSPEIASKSIRTSGWEPKSVEIHVSNLELLISKVGGSELYGKDNSIAVALRELIQNARDAIIARRSIEKGFKGLIRVRHISDGDNHEIVVEDDGIGMSYRVATGPLLDFGTSFWASDLARSEFPGLVSSGYKAVGRFGIGFYSIFMVAAKVSISSRRFDAGMDSVTQVRFPNGLSLRPLISSGPPAGFEANASTIVRIGLHPESGDPSSLPASKGRRIHEPERRVPIKQGLAILCAGLDVGVELIDRDGVISVVHTPLSDLEDLDSRKAWLQDISGLKDGDDSYGVLIEHASRLRPLIDGGVVKGLAAISTCASNNTTGWTSISTVGGLAIDVNTSNFYRFVGAIDFHPRSAKREPSSVPSVEGGVFEAWSKEQKSLLPKFSERPLDWCFATSSFASLGVDPIDVATFIVRTKDDIGILRLDKLVDVIVDVGLAFYTSSVIEHIEVHHTEGAFRNFPTFFPVANSSFLSLRRDDKGNYISTSAMSCIERRCLARSVNLELEIIPNVVRTALGEVSVMIARGVKKIN
jgi:hypothetical protein